MSSNPSYANYQTLGPPAASNYAPIAEGYERETCRLCDGTNLVAVLKLTPTPPANAFVPVERLDESERLFPLNVNFCKNCSHLQLSYVVSPDVLFRNYVYVSGTSPVMVQHLKEYADEAVSLVDIQNEDFVFEFGSNDGTLLRQFQRLGFDNVLGMDPAENIAEVANSAGVPTISKFFSLESAKDVRNRFGTAKLICANHCCAHIDDFHSIVEGVKELLAKDGIWIFEVGYLLSVVKDSLFDTIYHEHIDFHSVEPIRRFCLAQGLQLLNASVNRIQGGSLRCYVGWPGTSPTISGGSDAVLDLVRAENAAGLYNESVFMRWAKAIDSTREEVISLLAGLRTAGKSIAGFGAPAKATTLMYHFGITKDIISFIVDDNALKQGLYTPGLRIPVVSANHLYEKQPDYLVILAWNFAESIMKQHEKFLLAGGRFIVPLPELRVLKTLP